MSERIVAIVPVRSQREGKTRLASVLGPRAREAMLRRMAERVVRAAIESDVVETILIVSPDPDVLTWASGQGQTVVPLPQPAGLPGLNGAIKAGRRWASARGADAILSLFADLPLLEPDDIRRLVEDSKPIVLGPDRRGEGTNALLLRLTGPGMAFQFAFGEGSLARHRAEARRLDLEVALHDAPGIGFDLDTPQDWADFLAAAAVTHPDLVGAGTLGYSEAFVPRRPTGCGAGVE